MQTVETLALRIYGGPLGTGLNPQALVAVGSVPDNFRPMPPTIVDESQSWMITHAQGYTSYAMYSKEGVFAGNGIPGQLMFYVFLPAQKRLANGKSVLGLLDSLYDEFSIHNMMGGRLPDKPIDNSTYSMLLKRYHLEDRPMPLPVMAGHEPAALCVENRAQLEALMRHSRYNELLKVGRLELGMHCTSTIALNVKGSNPRRANPKPPKDDSTTTGPTSSKEASQGKPSPSTNPSSVMEGTETPVSYEVFLNGQSTGHKLTHPTDMFRSGLQSTKYVEFDAISFTLSDVLLAPNFILKLGTATVQLDVASQRIQCTIPKRDIMYKLVIDIVGGNENDQATIRNAIKNGKIRISLGSEDITDLKEIKYADVSGKELALYPSATDKHLLSVKSSVEPSKRELKLKLSVRRKDIPPTAPPQPFAPSKQEIPDSPHKEGKSLNQNLTRKDLIVSLALCLILGFAGGWFLRGSDHTDDTPRSPITIQEEACSPVEPLQQENITPPSPTISDADVANAAAEQAQREAEEAAARQQAEAKKKAEAEAKQKAEAEAKQKAEQQQVAAANAAKVAQDKAEILQMVNRRESITRIRAHQGWTSLSQVERFAVETIYNLGNKKGAAKQRVKDYLEGRTFYSWEEVIAARQEIIAIE